MKILDITRRAARSLKQAKIRTILTSLAIAVGAFTLTLAIAAGEGARQYADSIVNRNVDPRALIVAKDESVFGGPGGQTGPQEYDPDATSFGQATGGTTLKRLNQDDIEKIAAIDGVEQIEPLYDVTIKHIAPVSDPERRYVSTVSTYDPRIVIETTAGTLPPLGTNIQSDEVTIPDAFARALGFASAEEAIGQQVVLRLERPANIDGESIQDLFLTQGPAAFENIETTITRDVTLTIVATTNISELSFQGSSAITIPSETAQSMSEFLTDGTDDFQKFLLAGVIADEGANPEDVKNAINSAGYTSQTAQDLQQFLFQIVNVLQGIVAGFGVLALIASVFGIINTQYISVLERTQQIGLMKALGMRGRDVSRLFRIEAAWIGFLGGVIGSLGAVATGTALNPTITQQLALGEGTNLLIFMPLPILGLIVLLMIVAITAGILPARKAARLDPIEALRTE